MIPWPLFNANDALCRLRFIPISVLIISLAACMPFPTQDPMQVYQLPEPSTDASTEAPLNRVLRVNLPNANRTLSSTRILVAPQAQQLNAYQGARWSDNAPRLLQDYLIESFRQTGRLNAVINEASRIGADLELVSDLRAFQSEYRDGQPEVVIRLEAHLLESRQQRIIASQQFVARASSEGTDVERVVNAFGRAAEDLSHQVITWTLEQASTQR